MTASSITKTADPGPSPALDDQGRDGPRKRRDPEDRLHVSALVFGLFDARASHIDYFDTPGGRELERWYRRRRAARRHAPR